MDRELMQQALKALEDAPYMSNKDDYGRLEKITEALRKAINSEKDQMRMDREHIGYIEREEGYYKLYASPKGSIVTHAFILCKYCNGSIYHCMGPKYDAVCFSCYEKDPELR